MAILTETALHARGIPILSLFAVCPGPVQSLLEFLVVVDLFVYTTDEFGHVHRLDAHAQVGLKEGGIHNGTGNAHGGASHGQVRLVFHASQGQPSPGELQQPFLHIEWDRFIARVLNVASVDAKGGQALLVVGSQDRRQVDSAGALGTVKAPDSLGCVGIHVHCLCTITPTRCDREGYANARVGEFGGSLGSLCDTADAGVSDYALNRQAIRVPKVLLQKPSSRASHAHRLVLQRFANPSPATVNRGADADLGHVADQPVSWCSHLEFCHLVLL
jgi:hypothetical protein